MIKKVWAKFKDMDLECVCDEHHKKCKSDDDCKEYVVNFIEIDRDHDAEEAVAHVEREAVKLRNDIKKFQSKVSRSIRKFKI